MKAFEQLHAPLDRAIFDEEYWVCKAGLFRPVPELLQPLFDDDKINDPLSLIEAGHDIFRILPAKNLNIRDGNGIDAQYAWNSDRDVTLVAELTQLTANSVLQYCMKQIESIGVPFRRFWPNIYFSRAGSGFTRHWDNHENFIVGLQGVKKFQVAPNNYVAYPMQNADNVNPHVQGFQEEIEGERTADFLPGMLEIEVGKGDCIFIPRGWWHEAFAQDDGSVSLTIAVWTCTWGDLLAAGGIDRPASATDLSLRTPLSLDANSIPEDLGLPADSIDRLPILRAQAELAAIADVTADWRVGLKKRLSEKGYSGR